MWLSCSVGAVRGGAGRTALLLNLHWEIISKAGTWKPGLYPQWGKVMLCNKQTQEHDAWIFFLVQGSNRGGPGAGGGMWRWGSGQWHGFTGDHRLGSMLLTKKLVTVAEIWGKCMTRPLSFHRAQGFLGPCSAPSGVRGQPPGHAFLSCDCWVGRSFFHL